MRFNYWSTLCLVFLMPVSCEKEEPVEEVVNEVFARFSCNASAVLKGESIYFTNRSEFAESFLWDFGDGESSRERDPVHQYKEKGDFKVKLYAYSGQDSSTFSYGVYIRERRLKVMSYSITTSGGAVPELYPRWDYEGQGHWNMDRREELAAIIKYFDPDILGIQEAWSWDYGDPKVVEEFSEQIGMEYFIYPENEEVKWNDLLIYSKFPLEQKVKFFHYPCVPNRFQDGLLMLGAEVALDSFTKLDFYSSNLLMTTREEVSECELETLSDHFLSMKEHRSILVGDMFWGRQLPVAEIMNEAGLHLVNHPLLHNITHMTYDHLWTSLCFYHGAECYDEQNLQDLLPEEIFTLLDEASQRYPVMATIYF